MGGVMINTGLRSTVAEVGRRSGDVHETLKSAVCNRSWWRIELRSIDPVLSFTKWACTRMNDWVGGGG